MTNGELTIRINQAAWALAHPPPDHDGDLRFSFHLQRKRGAQVIGGETPESAPNIDRVLIRGIVLAQQWAHELEQGVIPSISALAQREGICRQYVSRLMPLAYLAPDLVERVITGRQPRSMTLQSLTSDPMPLAWEQQREWFERGAA